jgi:predicted O-methyltransferase YrrM
MLRALCFILILGVSAPILAAEPAPAAETVDLDKFMAELEKFGRENRRLNVPADHGRFLQLLVEATKAQRALEIGASNGYSGLWIARGLRRTGGKLVTIEYDKVRGGEAKENFAKAGMDDIITLHLDDAFKVIPQLEGEFDLIFCDAWKDDYKKFFDLTFPKLKPGGLFVAHNAIQSADGMKDFLDAVKTDPRLITSIVQMGRDGFSVSIKRVEGK